MRAPKLSSDVLKLYRISASPENVKSNPISRISRMNNKRKILHKWKESKCMKQKVKILDLGIMLCLSLKVNLISSIQMDEY